MVISLDDYVDELLQMDINRFEVMVMPKIDSALDDSCVLAMEDDKDALPVLASYVTMDVSIAHIVSPNILGHVYDFVDPPLLFHSHSNDALAFSSIDLSFYFEYLSSSSIDLCASHSPTTHLHDIEV